METLKKYWWVVVALIAGCFMFKKRKTIKRKFKKNRNRAGGFIKKYGFKNYLKARKRKRKERRGRAMRLKGNRIYRNA